MRRLLCDEPAPQATCRESTEEGRPVDPRSRDRQAGWCTARALSRPLEPLFDPCAGDDRVAIAEAHPGAERAVLVPKSAELCIEPADLFLDLRVVLRREAMPEFGTLLTEALDLRVD